MLQSQLFTKTERTTQADEPSVNARLLWQAGYIDKLAAGIYTYLPLGLRVLKNVQEIVRQEMVGIGAQEILMPALHPKEYWAQTGRWQDPGTTVMFQFQGRGEQEFGLGWTHEEIVTPLAKRYLHSYRDLPFSVFQIQDKFRNELRAKSGLLRGREFSMKDLYSFHRDAGDLDQFYQQVMDAYRRVFQRCGLDAIVVEASGGAFAKYSHEYQVVTPDGEDMVFACQQCRYAQNREISEFKTGDTCPKCGGKFHEEKAIEVGNIFKLGTRFSSAFNLRYLDEHGVSQPVLMGCYGIGPSRVMGAIAEIHHDEHGLRWPASVAPFCVHLLMLGKIATVKDRALEVYRQLQTHGIATLLDDRLEVTAGEKFHDADLMGMPWRAVVSAKSGEHIELKSRATGKMEMLTLEELRESVK